jgi:hypothetical protein
MVLFWPGHTLAMSCVEPSRHARQSDAFTSAWHNTRPYAWTDAALVVFVANPVDTAAVAGSDARTLRSAWNVLPRVRVVWTDCVEWVVGVGYCCEDVEIGLGQL